MRRCFKVKKILFAEDNEFLFRALMSLRDFSLIEARTGFDCIDLAK